MKMLRLGLGTLFVSQVMFGGAANAALLGVQQKYPDIALDAASLQMFWNGAAAGGGTLTLRGFSTTLSLASGGTVAAGTLYQQNNSALTSSGNDTNSGNGDLGLAGLPAGSKTFMTLNINASGALTGGTITIPVGNASPANGNASFGWVGTVNGLGTEESFGGTAATNFFRFDGTWNVQKVDYNFGTANAANAALVDNMAVTGLQGGFKVNINSNFDNANLVANLFGANDWYVSGSSLNATQLGQLGLDGTAARIATGVSGADVFVPVPAALWLLGSAIAGLPLFRRRVTA